MSGTNDVGIILAIMASLVILGIVAPLIQQATFYTVTSGGASDYKIISTNSSTIMNPSYDPTGPTPLNALGGIAVAIFWVFGWMPAWLVSLHVLIRVILILLIYRQIRSGSG